MEFNQPAKKQLLILLAVAAVVFGLLTLSANWNSPNSDSNTYQAVFLTNGQYYFGKLTGTNNEYPVLTDIYYLETNQAKFSLVKLGNEVHGPEDAMYLNQEQILFWENLKQDSRVVKAIEQEKGSAKSKK